MTNPPTANSSPRKTIELTPSDDEMIKPAELIDITGNTELTLSARQLYNALLAHAFGRDMGIEGQDWSIPLSTLRGAHKGNERLEDSIIALMKTIVTVRLQDGSTRRVALLGGNDMGMPDRPHGQLTYSFDKRLVPVLQESTVFGKLELSVMKAFSTKYALALYEAISRRVRLKHIFHEEMSLEAFRDLLGVPDGKLGTFGNLNQYAIKPALTEINALASFGVQIQPLKQSRKVTGVTLFWHRKSLDEIKQAYAELQRPKVGRKARLTGDAENVVEPQIELGL
mgnify:CR=1 FL=1